jgi:hypothetical protein
MDLSLEGWVSQIFDHPVKADSFWKDVDAWHYRTWDPMAHKALALEFLTRLFEDPGELPQRFTRGQIDHGLTYLLSVSEYTTLPCDLELPWPDRRRCLASMATLYEQLIAPVYGDDLGHLARRATGSITGSYMCWDTSPIYTAIEGPEFKLIEGELLTVFRKVLTLKSEACLESVLHALGHFKQYWRSPSEEIVAVFLQRDDISSELRRYAELAARGDIL